VPRSSSVTTGTVGPDRRRRQGPAREKEAGTPPRHSHHRSRPSNGDDAGPTGAKPAAKPLSHACVGAARDSSSLARFAQAIRQHKRHRAHQPPAAAATDSVQASRRRAEPQRDDCVFALIVHSVPPTHAARGWPSPLRRLRHGDAGQQERDDSAGGSAECAGSAGRASGQKDIQWSASRRSQPHHTPATDRRAAACWTVPDRTYGSSRKYAATWRG